MTTTYSCLGQVDAPPILKWGHSALSESWFKTPWFAIESAYELARKLGTHEKGRIQFCSSTITACGKRRSVRFADDVDLKIFHPDSFCSASFRIPAVSLRDWDELHSSHCTNVCPAKVTASDDHLSRSDFSPLNFRPPLRSIENLPVNFKSDSCTPLEPLSCKAVSIRGGVASRVVSDVPVSSFHRSDNFYDVPSTWPLPNDPAPDEDADAQVFLHEAPESVQFLYDALHHEGVIFGPRIDDSVFLRSWHIHHLHEPRCWHSRVIELTGHWRHWFRDILSGWRDKNDPNEPTIFSVVYPDPPRSGEGQEILFDIIISQGFDTPRHAGLITVLQRDDRVARARYSLAASLPDVVSGFQIVQSADILHECHMYDCTVRHAYLVIPFTMAPLHDMQDGDSFTIAVSSAASSSSGQAELHLPQVPAEESQSGPSCNSPDFSNELHVGPQEDTPDDPSSSSSHGVSDSDLQGVHIFRLGFPQSFGRLRWDFIEHVIVDAARAIGVPLISL